GNVGDSACAIPAMYAIRRAYPNAHITVLTSPGKRASPGAKELVGHTDWVDHVRCYYSDDVNSIKKRLKFIQSLRAEAFDAWFELSIDDSPPRTILRNMVMAKLAGAKWGYGWQITTIRCGSRAQSEYLVFQNEVNRLLSHLGRIGISGPPVFPIQV